MFTLIVDNVRSMHNVGSFFRTADAMGFSSIHLCGITPTPMGRLGAPRTQIQKVALGAETHVPWKQWGGTAQCLTALKKEGWYLLACEQGTSSKNLSSFMPPRASRVALVVGNELSGLKEEIISLCDDVVQIPMKGSKESLNVSVAFGIIAWELVTRLKKQTKS